MLDNIYRWYLNFLNRRNKRMKRRFKNVEPSDD